MNLGAVRVGAAAPTANVSVTNVATAAPQAALNASIVSIGAPVTAGGSFNLLAPGATSAAALQVGMSTATAGNFTGANAGSATIALVSDANNVGGCAPNCQLNLASQQVSVSGKVYTPAVGQLATASVDFGIVRVGDTPAARNITVNNSAAASALNDALRVNLSGVAGPFGGASSVAGVAAQASGNIAVSLNTASAGNHTQGGTLIMLSQNADMTDASAGANAAVQVHAQINNLADARFRKLAGLGLLSVAGSNYVLDLGNVALGRNLSNVLHLDNHLLGLPQDDLSGGAFNFLDPKDFGYTGFNPLAVLAPGGTSGDLTVAFMAATLGQLQDVIAFDGFSTNANGAPVAEHRQLLIRANVFDPNGNPIPEPGTLYLLLLAAAGAAIARRQRARGLAPTLH